MAIIFAIFYYMIQLPLLYNRIDVLIVVSRFRAVHSQYLPMQHRREILPDILLFTL